MRAARRPAPAGSCLSLLAPALPVGGLRFFVGVEVAQRFAATGAVGPVVAAGAVVRAGRIEADPAEGDPVVALLVAEQFAMDTAAKFVEFSLPLGGGLIGWRKRFAHFGNGWPRG